MPSGSASHRARDLLARAARLLATLTGAPPDLGPFSVGALLASLLGAVVLVGLVNLLRRGRIR